MLLVSLVLGTVSSAGDRSWKGGGGEVRKGHCDTLQVKLDEAKCNNHVCQCVVEICQGNQGIAVLRLQYYVAKRYLHCIQECAVSKFYKNA